MKNSESNLSIVIVNYNAGQFLINCLSKLTEINNEIKLDIWVVDNASSDGSLEEAEQKFPKVNYIKNTENLGYGKANNIALRKIKSEYILLLNPDCIVSLKTIKFMLGFMKGSENVGAASCLVEQADGSIDWASHRGFPTPWAAFLYYVLGDDSRYHLTEENMKVPHQVDSISGAFFMTKRSVLEKVGFFDEDYFLYAEDLDLCFRMKEKGFKIMYVPQVVALHYKGVTSGIKKHSKEISNAADQSRVKALNSFYQTMKIFYKKHLERKYPFFVNILVYLGINLKWFLAKRKMQV
ncbi:MAG: glycosyltransferase family 2 protein [Candidatus Daviesbacteria bacterium]|nr:glycosyltransferase family 2 protein [Candidatus Daviesbacteria bacterium]